MGQVIETLLSSLASFFGIEAAKFALGDIFPFLVVTGMVWYGGLLAVLLIASAVLPKREWNDPVPLWETMVLGVLVLGMTVAVWWAGFYVLLVL
ncbi:hypothetical protein L0664_05570 [Octadecabacter sp. G9-8]|uniref:Uncharacterized protein n=1 Tax=Octadecabacter dasysiphoniae TaxID=2909341 RepID=A0ABS9CTH1_9RHOB|nr:hypothetical protein [Octadecabacter dasysiphoniae]MCF2870529.1 hypothetical protein [Octadecabacter dasysiphoniae]